MRLVIFFSILCVCVYIILFIYELALNQGDSKGSAKGGESSSKRDVYPNPNVQVENVNTCTTTGCVAGNILWIHNDIGIWCWIVLLWNWQLAHQGSFSQGVNYTNSQVIDYSLMQCIPFFSWAWGVALIMKMAIFLFNLPWVQC